MDERQVLLERANSLGLKFPKNIGNEKLAERIKAREAEIAADKNTKPIEGTTGAAAENGHAPQAGAPIAPADNTPAQSDASGGTAQPGAVLQTEAPEEGHTVTVIGPQKGRRRIGRRFGQEPVNIPAEDLSEEEFDALMADPMLAVSVS